VGFVGFETRAAVAGDIAVTAQLTAAGLHALAGWGGAQYGWSDAVIDVGTVGFSRVVGGKLRAMGDGSKAWDLCSSAFGSRSSGVEAAYLRWWTRQLN
jgi:hypothetical protein